MNGTAKGFFKSGRGLRQGDHLSPYLFIVLEEVLIRLLRKEFDREGLVRFDKPEVLQIFLIYYTQMIFSLMVADRP